LSESKLAMNTIRAYASPEAHVIYGTAYDDSLGEDVRVTVVATGLSRPRRTAPPLQVLRTGTYDAAPSAMANTHAAISASTMQRSMGNSTMASASGMGGGTGISAPAPASASTDYGTLSTPAVWRGSRTTAAQKVDALSSGGMDDYEIPAFLRKQAD
jgi:cell division protein FtsZ